MKYRTMIFSNFLLPDFRRQGVGKGAGMLCRDHFCNIFSSQYFKDGPGEKSPYKQTKSLRPGVSNRNVLGLPSFPLLGDTALQYVHFLLCSRKLSLGSVKCFPFEKNFSYFKPLEKILHIYLYLKICTELNIFSIISLYLYSRIQIRICPNWILILGSQN